MTIEKQDKLLERIETELTNKDVEIFLYDYRKFPTQDSISIELPDITEFLKKKKYIVIVLLDLRCNFVEIKPIPQKNNTVTIQQKSISIQNLINVLKELNDKKQNTVETFRYTDKEYTFKKTQANRFNKTLIINDVKEDYFAKISNNAAKTVFFWFEGMVNDDKQIKNIVIQSERHTLTVGWKILFGSIAIFLVYIIKQTIVNMYVLRKMLTEKNNYKNEPIKTNNNNNIQNNQLYSNYYNVKTTTTQAQLMPPEKKKKKKVVLPDFNSTTVGSLILLMIYNPIWLRSPRHFLFYLWSVNLIILFVMFFVVRSRGHTTYYHDPYYYSSRYHTTISYDPPKSTNTNEKIYLFYNIILLSYCLIGLLFFACKNILHFQNMWRKRYYISGKNWPLWFFSFTLLWWWW